MEETSRREDNLIASGVEFVRAIAEVHGAEQGMELYEKIAEVLGADVKGKIFMAMLLGTHHASVELSLSVSFNPISAVPIIKAIRENSAEGFGLKEAKDMYDKMKAGSRIKFNIEPDSGNYAKVAAEFRNLGCTLH